MCVTLLHGLYMNVFMLYVMVATCGCPGILHWVTHLAFLHPAIHYYFHTKYDRFVGWCNHMNLIPVGDAHFDGVYFRFKMTQMWKIFSCAFTPSVYSPNLFPRDFVPDLSYKLSGGSTLFTTLCDATQPCTSEISDPDLIRISIADGDIKILCTECANEGPTRRYFRHSLFNKIIISNTLFDADVNMLNGFDVSIRKNNTYLSTFMDQFV